VSTGSEGSVSFETAKGSLGSVFVKDGSATLNVNNAPQWAEDGNGCLSRDAAFAGRRPAPVSPRIAAGCRDLRSRPLRRRCR